MRAEGYVGGTPWVSFIIPAYNEAARLPEGLDALRRYAESRDLACEVIVVDDGSVDETRTVVTEAARHWPRVRLLPQPHAGKGAAVRAGVRAACGAMVALADADLSMPPEGFDRFQWAALGPSDVAIGSREAPGARRYGEPWYRHVMGRAYNTLVHWLLLPGIQDTQCGFKCLPRALAVELCAQQTRVGWSFDVELLYVARLSGCAIHEIGIDWHYRAGGQVRLLRDTLAMTRDLVAIRRNGRRGRYRALVSEPARAPVGGSPWSARSSQRE